MANLWKQLDLASCKDTSCWTPANVENTDIRWRLRIDDILILCCSLITLLRSDQGLVRQAVGRREGCLLTLCEQERGLWL